MLTITVPETRYFDDETQRFVNMPAVVLELEHSLVSLSKWEQIFEKPFLSKEQMSDSEALTYVSCMNMTPDVPLEVFTRMSRENMNKVREYINAKMTATWFSDEGPNRPSRETITSELIYYWMITAGIPIEFENWHLNRLFTLIKVINRKNTPPKQQPKASIAERRRLLNEQRRRELGTSG